MTNEEKEELRKKSVVPYKYGVSFGGHGTYMRFLR
jgi:hypothetical protein